jgi:DNA-binding transcriptional MerR regulator
MARRTLTGAMNLMMNNQTTSDDKKSSQKFDLKTKIHKIPDKLGFKIGEVAKYVGVKSYVLRYWETEFESLSPKKSDNGQRFYTKKDIEMALTIRKLLYEDRFSIEGAKSVLKKMKAMSRGSQIVAEATAITEDTTESEIIEAHKPAAEIVWNKTKSASTKPQAQVGASVKRVESSVAVPSQEEIDKKVKEITQYWSTSVDYLIEEIRQARKRLDSAEN